MGAVEDTRKIFQDFLAPELREIKVRLDVMEKRIDGVDQKIDKVSEKLTAKIDKLNEKIDRLEDKFDLLDRRSEQRHDSLMMQLGRIVNEGEIRERLARLEGERPPQ